jgi:hypothetical protein
MENISYQFQKRNIMTNQETILNEPFETLWQKGETSIPLYYDFSLN